MSLAVSPRAHSHVKGGKAPLGPAVSAEGSVEWFSSGSKGWLRL